MSDAIASGYASSPAQAEREARIRRDAARSWRFDVGMERLIRMRDDHPDFYASRVSPSQKLALGYYLRYREAAEAEGIDTSAPNGKEQP